MTCDVISDKIRQVDENCQRCPILIDKKIKTRFICLISGNNDKLYIVAISLQRFLHLGF
jgi:hypothetical protein